ncbi:hypothetical protein [Sulfurimonas hydrogeniphila]|uniref:hypothetical protein n=1 Tax=Sulfurimonas hydrogeniphila TaxID=2509341 RepID=UPI00165FA8FF|nr:hypothetical protein [Sulfurimonas hydrogeniphila]
MKKSEEEIVKLIIEVLEDLLIEEYLNSEQYEIDSHEEHEAREDKYASDPDY